MTGSDLTVVATTHISRPIDDVRKHFLDFDHAVRDRILRRVKWTWVSGHASGERRLRRETRLLGRSVVDEVVVEQNDEGDVTERVVAGDNQGMLVIHNFEPHGEGATFVESEALVPLGGFNWAVGPLLKGAVRRSLERALEDHKWDLEGGGYEPDKAHGQIDAAIALLAPVMTRTRALESDAKRLTLVAPLLEAACLTAIADNDADDAERDVIKTMVHRLGIAALDDDAIEALIASSIDHARSHGLERRCDELGGRLKAIDLAEPGLIVATIVAQVSRGIDQSELAMLQRLARASGVGEERLAGLVDDVDRRLTVKAP